MYKPITRYVDFRPMIYLGHCMIFSLLGLIIGTTINKFMKLIYAKNYNFFILLQHIFILSLVIYIIHTSISTQFVDDMQGYVAGLFFAGFYFGSQTNIINYVSKF